MLDVSIHVQRGSFELAASFCAPTPGITALFGRSGSGKSTLVGALNGLLPEVRGRIRIGDQPWLDTQQGIDVPAEERRIGCVFQQPRLFPHLSVDGNLAYAARRATRHPQFVARADVLELLGLGPLLQRRTGSLSGGECSRVALGRALLSQPRLLILDEPFASLDAARREEVMPYLERLRDHYALAMVYVSHQYDEVLRLASHVVLLEAGRVQASATPTALSLNEDLRRIVGGDRAGAVIEGPVIDWDEALCLATVAVGTGRLLLPGTGLRRGGMARVLVPARDVMLATTAPVGLSVRNQLAGTVTALTADPPGGWLVHVDVGGTTLLARVTTPAVRDLDIAPGQHLYVLVKAESLRGHAYPGATAA